MKHDSDVETYNDNNEEIYTCNTSLYDPSLGVCVLYLKRNDLSMSMNSKEVKRLNTFTIVN